jgi:GAF domain-containing protein
MEIDLLEQLGTQVAIAIQQASLFNQVQALNANLECQVQERTAQLEQKIGKFKNSISLKIFSYTQFPTICERDRWRVTRVAEFVDG